MEACGAQLERTKIIESMNMNKTFWVLLLASLPLWVSAQYRRIKVDNYHFGWISVSGGYSGLSENIDKVSTSGDFGGLIGAGYEFRRNSFWTSLGVQVQMHRSSTTLMGEYTFNKEHAGWPVNGQGEKAVGMDQQGRQFDPFYTVKPQKDQQNWNTVDIPLLLGYYYSGFYVGAGAKVGFSFNSRSKTSGTYNLAGDYPTAVGTFRMMNDHGFKDYTYSGDQAIKLKTQCAIIGELGYDVLSTIRTQDHICHVLKIGFYFEYGVLNTVAQAPKDAAPLTINTNDVTQAVINPYFYSTMGSKDRVAPYYVGLKVTYMIGGSRTTHSGTWHTGCQCYGN